MKNKEKKRNDKTIYVVQQFYAIINSQFITPLSIGVPKDTAKLKNS